MGLEGLSPRGVGSPFGGPRRRPIQCLSPRDGDAKDKWRSRLEDDLPKYSPSLALQAPLSDDDHTPSLQQGFCIQAPTGWTEDERDSVDEELSVSDEDLCDRFRVGLSLPPTEAALRVAQARSRLETESHVQAIAARHLHDFQIAVMEAEAADAKRAREQSVRREAAALAAASRIAAAEERRAKCRADMLSSLRSGHARTAEEVAEKLAMAAAAARELQRREEERRAEAATRARQEAEEAERRARDAKQAADEERARALREHDASKADAARAASSASQAGAERAADISPGPAPGAVSAARQSAPRVEVACSPGALAWRAQLVRLLTEARASVAAYKADAGTKAARRAVDKALTLHVQQVSASQEQVAAKSTALRALLASQPAGPPAAYAQLQLAAKFCVQCEVQVTRLPTFAFPLAEVAVAVGVAVPGFAEVLVAQLASLCPLCVPAAVERGAGAGADDEDVLKAQGYKIRNDADTGKVTRESTEEYLARMGAMVRFYAAVMQCDNPQNPHGLKQAWTWLARFLNGVPPSHVAATALNNFLHVAGYRLQRAYRQQAFKLFQVAGGQWLQLLEQRNDDQLHADVTRIKTYFQRKECDSEPEGRSLPQFDASSYDRA